MFITLPRSTYMLNSLLHYCVEFILENLIAENALKVYEFADFYEDKEMIESALKVIKNETLKTFESPDFEETKLSTMITILKQDDLQANEMDLYNALESLFAAQCVSSKLANENFCIGDMPVTNGDQRDEKESCLISKFREAIKKINFLEMTAEQFSQVAATSKLLLPEDSLAILASLHDSNNIKIKYPKDFATDKRQKSLPRAFFDISVDELHIGRILIELRSDVFPKTTEKFLALCTGNYKFGFKGATFINSDDNWRVLCTGDEKVCSKGLFFVGHDDNSRVASFSKKMYKDDYTKPESFILKHNGIVSLFSNDRCQSNAAKFYIDKCPDSSVDNKNVVIGKVVEGMNVVNVLKTFGAESEICIENCGEISRNVFDMEINE